LNGIRTVGDSAGTGATGVGSEGGGGESADEGSAAGSVAGAWAAGIATVAASCGTSGTDGFGFDGVSSVGTPRGGVASMVPTRAGVTDRCERSWRYDSAAGVIGRSDTPA
jgi:hypothetical protein